jgi:hypothetical protein
MTGSLCVAVVLFILRASKLGEHSFSMLVFGFTSFSTLLVKISSQWNILPMATKKMLCAARSGFKLENAKHPHQYTRYGRTVLWSDQFE